MEQYNILNYSVRNFILVIILSVSLPLKAQTNSNGSSPQFLFQDFAIGKVRMKNGLSQNVKLNYNTVSETMVYEKESKLYDLMNIGMIDAVIIHNRMFVPVRNIFHEVLLIAPIPLLVQYKGEILPPGTTVGYGVTSQVSNAKSLSHIKLSMGYYNLQLPADYTVKLDKVYLIRIQGKSHSFTNERQFLKIFPDKENELKEFIDQNSIKFEKTADILMLIRYCNELFPPGIRKT